MSPLKRQIDLDRIRVVSLHWLTVFLPVKLHGNRFTILEDFNCTAHLQCSFVFKTPLGKYGSCKWIAFFFN